MRRKPIVLSSAAAVALVAAVTVVAWGRGDGEGVAAREDAAAPAATAPPALTRTQLSRVVLQGGGPVEFKPGLDTLVLKVTLAPGGTTGGRISELGKPRNAE